MLNHVSGDLAVLLMDTLYGGEKSNLGSWGSCKDLVLTTWRGCSAAGEKAQSQLTFQGLDSGLILALLPAIPVLT